MASEASMCMPWLRIVIRARSAMVPTLHHGGLPQRFSRHLASGQPDTDVPGRHFFAVALAPVFIQLVTSSTPYCARRTFTSATMSLSMHHAARDGVCDHRLLVSLLHALHGQMWDVGQFTDCLLQLQRSNRERMEPMPSRLHVVLDRQEGLYCRALRGLPGTGVVRPHVRRACLA